MDEIVRTVYLLSGSFGAINLEDKMCIRDRAEGKAFVIAPKDSSGYHRIEKDPKILEQWYRDGYEQAMEQMDALKAYLQEDTGSTAEA